MSKQLEILRKKQKQFESSKKTGVFWRPDEGKHEVRILPPRPGREVFYEEFIYHYGLGKFGFVCNATFGKPCLICEKAEAWAEADSARKNKIAARIAARERFLCNIIDMNNTAAGPKIWSIPKTLLSEIISIMVNPDYDDITDPVHGFNLVLSKEGSGKKTRWQQILPRRNPTKLKKREWLKNRHNLLDYIKPYDKNEVRRALRELLTGEIKSGHGHEEDED